ncbi:hypothetical protein F5Y14DRAFT_449045 [Nemania sp. NC0429]|nr:hypothetical protein F5Y14DRAFT_449045 [Nemania sp. NC0429]
MSQHRGRISTCNALLRSTRNEFEVIALLCPDFIYKNSAKELEDHGARIVSVDLQNGSEETLATTIANVDIVVSFFPPNKNMQLGLIALATAAKRASVKRFVLSA